jgi:hypothetical protein
MDRFVDLLGGGYAAPGRIDANQNGFDVGGLPKSLDLVYIGLGREDDPLDFDQSYKLFVDAEYDPFEHVIASSGIRGEPNSPCVKRDKNPAPSARFLPLPGNL